MSATFEIKAIVCRQGNTLAEFDSQQSAETWISRRRLGGAELWVKENGKWVRR